MRLDAQAERFPPGGTGILSPVRAVHTRLRRLIVWALRSSEGVKPWASYALSVHGSRIRQNSSKFVAQIAQSARAATGRPQSTVLRPVGIAPYGECPTPEVLATSATSETCVSPYWDAKQILGFITKRARPVLYSRGLRRATCAQ